MSSLEYSEKFEVSSSPRIVHRCKLCRHFTTSFFLLENHVRRHRTPPPPFNCENSNIEPYHCTDCDFRTDLTLHLQTHLKKYHYLKRQNKQHSSDREYAIQYYICKNCDFQTHFMLKWLQHTTKCSKNKISPKIMCARGGKKGTIMCYRCCQCDFKSKYKSSVRKHLFSKHVSEDDIKWFKCDRCPYKAKRKETLRDHVVACHLDEHEINWYKCKHCSFKTKRPYNLKSHINALHLNEMNIKWFECKQCLFKTTHDSDLKRHCVRQHPSEEDMAPYRWEFCG